MNPVKIDIIKNVIPATIINWHHLIIAGPLEVLPDYVKDLQ